MVVTGDVEAVEICNDKWNTYKTLAKQGIETPKSWLEAQAVRDAAAAGLAAYPFILKPRWGMGSLSVYQADDEQELFVLDRKIRREIRESYLRYEAARDEANVLIQQKIRGAELGLDVVNDLDGNFRAVVVKKKGSMRAGETDESETVKILELEALGKQLSKLLRHRGNLDVDILEEDGKYYVLEMNARFGGGYPFSHAAGLNLPYALIMWAMGREPEEGCLEARPGVHAQKDIRLLVWGSE
jgi:carbamoyl-phosphate synthase large subunit